jgi:hypothetical protein
MVPYMQLYINNVHLIITVVYSIYLFLFILKHIVFTIFSTNYKKIIYSQKYLNIYKIIIKSY